MASGKSLYLRHIHGPHVQWFYKHEHRNNHDRRHGRTSTGKAFTIPRHLRQRGQNVPYRKPLEQEPDRG